MSNNQFKLIQEILKLSHAEDWELAKKEWALADIYEDDPSTCLCGHYPIIEHCVIHNAQTSNDAVVGNCCVKKFMGLPSDKIFTGLKRVRKENSKSLNREALDFAHRRNWVTAWEFDFYRDIQRKRATSLTQKQMNIKMRINETVLERFRNHRKSAAAIEPVKKLSFIVNKR